MDAASSAIRYLPLADNPADCVACACNSRRRRICYGHLRVGREEQTGAIIVDRKDTAALYSPPSPSLTAFTVYEMTPRLMVVEFGFFCAAAAATTEVCNSTGVGCLS